MRLESRCHTVKYDSIRQWCQKLEPDYARKLKKRQYRLGDTGHIDEVFVTIQGQRHYRYRVDNQDGDGLDILVQRHRNRQAVERLFRRLIKGQGGEPRWVVTDKLPSYAATHRTIMPTVQHLHDFYANNRAQVSHEPNSRSFHGSPFHRETRYGQ